MAAVHRENSYILCKQHSPLPILTSFLTLQLPSAPASLISRELSHSPLPRTKDPTVSSKIRYLGATLASRKTSGGLAAKSTSHTFRAHDPPCIVQAAAAVAATIVITADSIPTIPVITADTGRSRTCTEVRHRTVRIRSRPLTTAEIVGQTKRHRTRSRNRQTLLARRQPRLTVTITRPRAREHVDDGYERE